MAAYTEGLPSSFKYNSVLSLKSFEFVQAFLQRCRDSAIYLF